MRSILKIAAIRGPSLLVLAAATAVQAAPAAPVSGDNATAVTEIIVSARQRRETLKDVPAAISVLTASTLKAAGVSRAEGIVSLTPGVSMVNGARDADPSFAFVLDGIQLVNPASFNREFTDLQQVEVVKGPQGAVYGRNATAGAIIVTTTRPTDVPSGSMEFSAGDYGSYTVKGMVSGPITDKIGATLSADFRNTDGQYGNKLFSGQNNLDSYEGANVNVRVFAHLDSNTTLDLKGRYGKLTAGAIDYNAAFELPALAAVTTEKAFYQDVNHFNYTFQNNVPQDNRQTAGELSAKLDHDFGWANLTAWTLYSNIEDDLLADGTSASFGFFNTEPHCIASTAALNAQGVTLPSPQNLGATPGASFFGPYSPTTCDGYQYQRRVQTDESLEVRLTSPSDQRLRWMAGAYYLHVDRQVGVATGIDSGGAPPRSLYVPSNLPYSTEQLLWDDFRSNVGAVFGQVQYDILTHVEGSLGLRYDTEDRSDHNLVPTNAVTQYIDYSGPPYTGGAPLNPGLDPALNPAGIKDQSKTFSQLQPKVGLRWTISPAWTVYGDWGIGFKSGGFNNAGSQATIDAFINPVRVAAGFAPVAIDDTYKKEVSSEFELGAKARLFDGRVSLDAAVFQNTVHDMQFFEFFVGPFGLLRVVSNIDRVEIAGAELGAHWRATDYLTLDATGAYNHSRIDRNSVRPDTVGNQSPYTPDYTWNFGAQYDRPVGENGVMFHGRVDVRGVGPTWFSDVQNQSNPTVFELSFGALGRANYAKTERDAYTTTDLRLGLEWRNWTMTLFGTNIFDERYLNEVIPAPEFGGAFVSPAAGSRFGVAGAYKF